MTDDLLRDLRRFGPPIYVPLSSRWRVAGLEHSGGVPDGVVVFGADGGLEVRTESSSRPERPISIRIRNVQTASSPRQSLDTAWQKVIVSEAEADISVDGLPRPVRLLRSHNVFGFVLQLGGRVLRVGGRIDELETLALVRQDSPALAG